MPANTLTYNLAKFYDTNILPRIDHLRGTTKISKALQTLYLANQCTPSIHGRWNTTVNDITFSMNKLSDMRYLYMEPEITEKLAHLVKEDDITQFFDVGAYHGFYTSIAAQRVNVTSFEQSKTNCNVIKRNAQTAEVIDRPVWSSHEELSVPDNEGSTLKTGRGNTIKKSVRLDDYIEKDPDLVKIDVEGAELNVLKGAEEILEKNRPVLIIEVHNGRIMGGETEDIYRILDLYGYDIEVIGDRGQETHIKSIPN